MYKKGKKKRFATGVNIKKHEWKNGMVVGRLDAHVLNQQIQKKYQEAIELMNESSGELSVINRAAMTELSFYDWIAKEIEENPNIQEPTRKHHRTMLRGIVEFGKFKTFKDITQENIIAWDLVLRKRFSNAESARNYHKRFKTYVNKARQLKIY